MLQLASRFLSDKYPEEAKAKQLVSGLKGIYVWSFEFEKPGEYLESDVESIRSQLRGPERSRIVGVRSRKSGRTMPTCSSEAHNGNTTWSTVIAAEPKELTIVNIGGAITVGTVAGPGRSFRRAAIGQQG